MSDMNKILLSNTKEVAAAKGVLAKLFRLLLKDIALDPVRLHQHMQNYLNNPANNIDPDPVRRSYTRQNFMNAMAGEHMTWKTLFRAIRLLSPMWFEITIRAGWNNYFETKTSVMVKLHDEPTYEWENHDSWNTHGLESANDQYIPGFPEEYLTPLDEDFDEDDD